MTEEVQEKNLRAIKIALNTNKYTFKKLMEIADANIILQKWVIRYLKKCYLEYQKGEIEHMAQFTENNPGATEKQYNAELKKYFNLYSTPVINGSNYRKGLFLKYHPSEELEIDTKQIDAWYEEYWDKHREMVATEYKNFLSENPETTEKEKDNKLLDLFAEVGVPAGPTSTAFRSLLTKGEHTLRRGIPEKVKQVYSSTITRDVHSAWKKFSDDYYKNRKKLDKDRDYLSNKINEMQAELDSKLQTLQSGKAKDTKATKKEITNLKKQLKLKIKKLDRLHIPEGFPTFKSLNSAKKGFLAPDVIADKNVIWDTNSINTKYTLLPPNKKGETLIPWMKLHVNAGNSQQHAHVLPKVSEYRNPRVVCDGKRWYLSVAYEDTDILSHAIAHKKVGKGVVGVVFGLQDNIITFSRNQGFIDGIPNLASSKDLIYGRRYRHLMERAEKLQSIKDKILDNTKCKNKYNSASYRKCNKKFVRNQVHIANLKESYKKQMISAKIQELLEMGVGTVLIPNTEWSRIKQIKTKDLDNLNNLPDSQDKQNKQSRRKKAAHSLQMSQPSEYQQYFSRKCYEAGIEVRLVQDKTTSICSSCGFDDPSSHSFMATWECPHCGTKHITKENTAEVIASTPLEKTVEWTPDTALKDIKKEFSNV